MENRYQARCKTLWGTTGGAFTEEFSKRLTVEKATQTALKQQNKESLNQVYLSGETCISILYHLLK